jgi:hypothetical protein
MKPASRHRLKSLCLFLALPAILMTGVLSADDLDDLLTPTGTETKLVDDSSTEAWTGVVDAFRRNDLAKAKELGAAFLAADHKTSPYQLLGVQVMLDLANAENPAVTRDVGLTVEMKRLMSERDALRTKYANLQRAVQAADARINKLTANRTQAVQAGTAAYQECARAAEQIQLASAEMEAMKPEIEANKVKVGKVEVGTNENLKTDTMKLLDMLIEADEIEAAFAITNVFIRVAGSDLDVAKKQQDVIRLREDQKTADKIVSAIAAEIEPLAAAGKGEEAQTRLKTMIAKVETSGQSDSVKKMTLVKLKVLGLKVGSAKASEERDHAVAARRESEAKAAVSADSAELSERLGVLEKKLDAAQELFGTVIRSIDGFSEFSGDFKAESDKEKMAASLKEKMKSGQVSKDKVDNMVKAKSAHVGILREVEILQTEAPQLSAVQKGRLANLHATAETALELLKQVTP